MKQIGKILGGKNLSLVLYVLIAVGAALMLIPTGRAAKPKAERTDKTACEDTEKKLENLLTEVEGAGKVKVMITYKNDGTNVIAENRQDEEDKDESTLRTSTRRDIVLGEGSAPVVVAHQRPQIEGVVIVAQGGGNIGVKNSLIRAAEALLGAEPHKIEVLKMKTEG